MDESMALKEKRDIEKLMREKKRTLSLCIMMMSACEKMLDEDYPSWQEVRGLLKYSIDKLRKEHDSIKTDVNTSVF